jgi:hypothetical protein
MSILTNRELEFLASLNTDWRKLYWTELARLQSRDDADCASYGATAGGTGAESRHLPHVGRSVSQIIASARLRALT